MADAGERHSLSFSAYGAEIRVEADRREFVEGVRTRLDALLPEGVNPLVERADSHLFTVLLAPDGTVALSLDGAPIGQHASAPIALDYLAARIKLAVGEFATSHVFVHAGVVGIGGGAVVVPASSCQGKTTLVRELVLRGAVYYSDDFALVDGRVGSRRSRRRSRCDPTGATCARSSRRWRVSAASPERCPCQWTRCSSPTMIPAHNGSREDRSERGAPAIAAAHVADSTAPELSLAALGRMVAGASLWESPRGEVGEVADWIVASLLQDRSGPRP
jgi:hypothetical protein